MSLSKGLSSDAQIRPLQETRKWAQYPQFWSILNSQLHSYGTQSNREIPQDLKRTTTSIIHGQSYLAIGPGPTLLTPIHFSPSSFGFCTAETFDWSLSSEIKNVESCKRREKRWRY